MATPPFPVSLARELRTVVGLDSEWPIDIDGPTAVLPSSFAVDAGAAALVAATASAAAEVAAVRSRRTPHAVERPPVRIDTVAASLAFQSERHLQTEAKPELWDTLSGHFATTDGHVQFHTNFSHHRYGLLRALDLPDNSERSDVETACATLTSEHLESIVNNAGGIAAALRSFDAWNRHPHATHPRPTKPVVRTSLAPGAPRSLGPASAARPLEGVRVLDLTRIIAGPVCTRTLAAYGASVLRVGADHLPIIEPVLPDTTLGKGFCHLDLRTSDGRDRLFHLTRECDVVVTGFRPGALADAGVGREQLLDANPDLVLAELCAFGDSGPWGNRRGFDSITQTATGIVHAETEASGATKPRSLPCQFLDHGSGYLLSLGIMAGLLDRHREGGPQLVEVTLLGTRDWLVDLGRVDNIDFPTPTAEIVEQHLVARQTPFGPIAHIAHPGIFAGADLSFVRGPSRAGADPAEW